MNPRLTMSRWRSGSVTTFSASSTEACSTDMSSRIAYSEEGLALLVQQDPQRIGSERRAEGQQYEIQRSERERHESRPGPVPPERHAHHHVRRAPANRDDRQRDEHGNGESGRELIAPGLRRLHQRNRAHAERERRQTDERGQQSPDNEENADEVDLGGHGWLVAGGW